MENWSTSWCVKDSGKVNKEWGTLLLSEDYKENSVLVARKLLGKVLLVKEGASFCGGRIVETEAYRANDPAAHSARGETPRSAIMFGDPGVAYVYFIYGMYEMLNFVTEPKGQPGAVLIRALEPLIGTETMLERRKLNPKSGLKTHLTSGPGKLCRALGIRMDDNGQKLQGPRLFVFDDGQGVHSIASSPRVGIQKGQDLYWRFFVPGNPFVSNVPQNKDFRMEGGR